MLLWWVASLCWQLGECGLDTLPTPFCCGLNDLWDLGYMYMQGYYGNLEFLLCKVYWCK